MVKYFHKMIAYNNDHGFVQIIKEFIFDNQQYFVVKTQNNIYTGLGENNVEILGE